ADGVVDDAREVLSAPVATGETRQSEGRGEQPSVGEVVHSGHELLAREVARDAEHDQATGACDEREPAIARIAKGIRHLVSLPGSSPHAPPGRRRSGAGAARDDRAPREPPRLRWPEPR